MVSKLITPVIAALTSLIGGFVVLMVVVTVVAPGNQESIKDRFISAAGFIVGAVVDLLQAIGTAAMAAMK